MWRGLFFGEMGRKLRDTEGYYTEIFGEDTEEHGAFFGWRVGEL